MRKLNELFEQIKHRNRHKSTRKTTYNSPDFGDGFRE